MLQLEYLSDIPQTSGHPTPCNGSVYYQTPCTQLGWVFWCFLFCYNSNISLIYCGHLAGLWTSDSAQWPQCFFCIIGQLMPNLAECSNVFPFCYNSNISLIYCRHLTLCNGCSVFALSDNSCPIWPSVLMFSFHNISPFLFPDLFS